MEAEELFAAGRWSVPLWLGEQTRTNRSPRDSRAFVRAAAEATADSRRFIKLLVCELMCCKASTFSSLASKFLSNLKDLFAFHKRMPSQTSCFLVNEKNIREENKSISSMLNVSYSKFMRLRLKLPVHRRKYFFFRLLSYRFTRKKLVLEWTSICKRDPLVHCANYINLYMYASSYPRSLFQPMRPFEEPKIFRIIHKMGSLVLLSVLTPPQLTTTFTWMLNDTV